MEAEAEVRIVTIAVVVVEVLVRDMAIERKEMIESVVGSMRTQMQ